MKLKPHVYFLLTISLAVVSSLAAANRNLKVWANVLKEGLDDARGASSESHSRTVARVLAILEF